MGLVPSTSKVLVDLAQPLGSRLLPEPCTVNVPPMICKISAGSHHRLRELYVIVALHRRCWISVNNEGTIVSTVGEQDQVCFKLTSSNFDRFVGSWHRFRIIVRSSVTPISFFLFWSERYYITRVNCRRWRAMAAHTLLA